MLVQRLMLNNNPEIETKFRFGKRKKALFHYSYVFIIFCQQPTALNNNNDGH